MAKAAGIVLAVLIAGAWFAAAVLYQLLGLDPLGSRPWSMFELLDYRDLKEFWIAAAAGCVPPVAALVLASLGQREKVHGDAKWAREADARAAGLRAEKGIILGKFRGRYLMTDRDAHHLVIGPTGYGKGVGVIVPNLLNFDGSAVVFDIKFENFELTSGFRAAHGHDVFFWSPMNATAKTHRYNPLDLVRADPIFRVTDLQILASYLVPLPQKDPIWDQLARFFFVGLAMYVLDWNKRDGTPATIGEIYRLLNSHSDLQEWCSRIADNDVADPECRRLLSSYAAMTEKERSFVKTSLAKALNLWSNPLVDAATSATDFDIRNLRRKRTTIYVGTTVDSLGVLGPLVGLFFQQVFSALTQREPGPDEPHQVLLLMDEFASMGKMDVLTNAVTMIRSYGGRMMFVVQGLSQLQDPALYGKTGAETLVQNCDYVTILGSRDDGTTNYVVRRLGRKTVRTRSQTKSYGSVSRSISEQGRDLMMFDEVQKMPKTDSIILPGGHRPIRARKIRYFEEKDFTERLLDPVDVPVIDVSVATNGPLLVPDERPPGEISSAATNFASGGAVDTARTDSVATTLDAIEMLRSITDESVADEMRELDELAAEMIRAR